MNKVLPSIILAVAIVVSAHAQDEAIFHHYLVNPMIVNPAYAGFDEDVQIYGHLRSQWAGFQNAPKTYALTVNLPMTEKVGLGGMLLSEKFGSLQRQRGQLNYAYRYIGKTYKWSLGFSTEYHRSTMDPTVNDPTLYPTVDKNDPLVMDRIKGISFFDASVGIAAVFNEKIVVSLSSPNLIRARLGIVNDNSKSTFFRQALLMGGYRVKRGQITFEPGVQLRKVYETPIEVDFNVKAMAFENKFVGAVTYRPGSSGAFGLLLGTKQPGFQVFYSYNSSTAAFKAYERNAHEVTVGIEFQKPERKIDRGATRRYRN